MDNSALLALLERKIAVLDGAMGTMIQEYKLEEADFRGQRFADHESDLKGNNDLLSLTQPELIKNIHLAFLQHGADIIETNTFNATRISQSDYGLAGVARELNAAGARIARQAIIDAHTETNGPPKFVAGVLGPTNRTASVSPDVNDPGFRNIDFDTLKFSSGGGMAVQRPVAERWQEITGSVIAEGYGLTETSPVVAINRFDIEAFTGCIGLPVPSTECKIIDDEGRELPVDQVGELCVRGPQVMRGYWNSPEETSAVLDGDGWLSTGDIALIQENGYIKIVDRKKDMILVSGFNVYPNEIEDIAVSHPAVNEAAAIGVPDPKSTESVKLVVVRADDSLSEQTLIDYCKERLTGYKVPRQVQFVDELPKSNVGKILRRAVRDEFGVVN